MRYVLYPYKNGSRSVRALKEALTENGCRALEVRLEGSRYHPRVGHRVVNWGNSRGFSSPVATHGQPSVGPGALNGNPEAVQRFGNKLLAFQFWDSQQDKCSIPDFTTDKETALTWLQKSSIVLRHDLRGHSGKGIEIVEKGSEELPSAPLYVKYIPKDAEYRVHVFKESPDGEYRVIDVQRKVRDPQREPSDWKVRSHGNGFIFTRNTGDGRPHSDTMPRDVLVQALRAMASSGLEFAAIDVIYNNKREKAFILEANLAPGLEGQSVEIYSNAIRHYYGS